MSPNAGGGGGGCGISANEYSCAHGAKINFGDLTPYLTYAQVTVPCLWKTQLKARKHVPETPQSSSIAFHCQCHARDVGTSVQRTLHNLVQAIYGENRTCILLSKLYTHGLQSLFWNFITIYGC
jgi:hypothetical protein